MAKKIISKRNSRFLLYEMFDMQSVLKHTQYADDGLENNVGIK